VTTFSVGIPAPPSPVEPGSATTFTVMVRNTGSTVDRYRCELVGIDPSWVEVEPDALGLFPNASEAVPGRNSEATPTRGSFTVTIRPPRDSTALAGALPFGAKVQSEQDASNSYVEESSLEILPFDDLRASLHPTVLGARSSATSAMQVVNEGNHPEVVTFAGSDPTGEMRFSFEPTNVTVGPGGRATTRVQMSVDAPGAYPFTIEARPSSPAARPIPMTGSFEKRPVVSRGVPAGLVSLVALGLGAVLVWGVLRSLGVIPGSAPTAAASPGGTLGGVVVPTAPTVTPVATPRPPATRPPATAPPVATPVSPVQFDRLLVDGELFPNQFITSANGRYRLTLQGDGNLVVTRTATGIPIWAPIKSRDVPGGYAWLQGDGHFVLYEFKPASLNNVVWATGIFDLDRHHDARVVLENDGNLVVYWEQDVKWESQTDQGCQLECR